MGIPESMRMYYRMVFLN